MSDNVALKAYGDSGTSEIKLSNTIIDQTTPNFSSTFDAENEGVITSQGYNLTNTNGGGYFTMASDRKNIDAMLGPLQDNGGPTFTHALLPGSSAIDQGNSSLTTDQRGAARPIDDLNSVNGSGNNSDIGAFELQAASQFLNLSTRKEVGTGDDVLIGGFIVAGTDPKNIIVRGLGPSLPVSGALGDPTLELHDATGTLLALNNNWKNTQQAEITATGIPPSNDLESAIVYSLTSQPLANGGAAYTAILGDHNGSTGIGLLEFYDLAQTANSQLVNISTRGFVGTGDDVLIGGFIAGPVTGNFVKVLVRALGPSLGTAGVANALQDPTLELHDGQGSIVASNDNWQDTQAAAIQATTIPPSDPRESAILQSLTPGAYTAIVRGVSDATGVGLVEFYALN